MTLICLILGYLAGSVPTGFLAVKALRKIDIRDFGSGNVGATNVGRLLGRKWAIAVALFDASKGGLAVLLVSLFSDSDTTMALTGVCSVVGHNYPIWLNFKGGKGVATTFGVFGFFDIFSPMPAIIGVCSWYLIMKKTKYVSIASMAGLIISAALMPVFGMPRAYYIAAIFLAGLSVWRHRANISRVVEGTEGRIG